MLVKTDGSQKSGTKGLGWGFIIYSDEKERLVDRFGYEELHASKDTNNTAEYTAIIEALNYIRMCGKNHDTWILNTDSRLCANQLNSKWKVRAGNIINLFSRARSLLNDFSRLTIRWVPREQLSEVDELANYARMSKMRGGNGDL